MLVFNFGDELASTTAEDFVTELLARRFGAAGVVTGEDFTFGKGRGGDGEAWYWGEPKMSRSRRTLPISAPLVDELKKHKDSQEKTRRNLADRWRDLDLVFTMPLGQPINSEVLGRCGLRATGCALRTKELI